MIKLTNARNKRFLSSTTLPSQTIIVLHETAAFFFNRTAAIHFLTFLGWYEKLFMHIYMILIKCYLCNEDGLIEGVFTVPSVDEYVMHVLQRNECLLCDHVGHCATDMWKCRDIPSTE